MKDAASKSDTQDIVVEEVLPHAPGTIWKALTTGELITRWLGMPLSGFEPIEGKRFTFTTTPAGAWDGLIQCQVLEAVPNERLVYTWQGGHEGNVGYGSRLETVVTWVLSKAEMAPAFALSIRVSCCRATILPSGIWAQAGRRSFPVSAPSQRKSCIRSFHATIDCIRRWKGISTDRR